MYIIWTIFDTFFANRQNDDIPKILIIVKPTAIQICVGPVPPDRDKHELAKSATQGMVVDVRARFYRVYNMDNI